MWITKIVAVVVSVTALSRVACAIEPPTKICGPIEQLSDSFKMNYKGLAGVYVDLLNDKPKDPKNISGYMMGMSNSALHRCNCLSGKVTITTQPEQHRTYGAWTELSSLVTCAGKVLK